MYFTVRRASVVVIVGMLATLAIGIVGIVAIVIWTLTLPYRMGDYVRRTGPFRFPVIYDVYKWKYAGTIVSAYGNATRMAEDWRLMQHIAATHVPSKFSTMKQSPAELVVHMRLGDVIDNHKRSVVKFLAGDGEPYIATNVAGGSRWRGGECTPKRCVSEGYVKPQSFFETIISKLKTEHVDVRHVTLVSGSHKQTIRPEKSQEYLQVVRRLFEEAGFEVEVRWNADPDDDFKFLTEASHVVLTGGGFSAAVKEVAKLNGAHLHDVD